MSTTTTNLSLTKPDGTDYVDIDDINGNMDTIDAAVGAVPVATKGSLQSQVNTLGAAVGDVPVSTKGSLQDQVTSLGESITRKQYTVTTTANQYVSPFSAYGSVDLTSDVVLFGHVASIVVNSSASSNPAIAYLRDNNCFVVSGVAGSIKLFVEFRREL